MSDDEEGGHDEEPWLVSYADMMTLLFGFFVLMYAFAMAKLEKVPDFDDNMIHLRKELTKYFGGEFALPLKEAAEEFKRDISESEALKGLEVKATPEGLDIILRSHGVFASGTAQLQPKVSAALAVLAEKVLRQNRQYEVVVEGHTDDVPIRKSARLFPTNWELSAARASSVVRLFAGAGIPQDKLAVVGYGASRPVVPNRDAAGEPILENMAKNRRIRVKVIALDELKENSDVIFGGDAVDVQEGDVAPQDGESVTPTSPVETESEPSSQ